ncbi:MAG: glycosyltransferase [Paenibacillaceae bacterium]|jgi:glycosyltransferase involved in cell wall biosynthesis|nr:glycosyltransferase [Paenibacillaceae bacterium]
MTVLIPAYEPDGRLLELILQLKAAGNPRILIVDDGSGEAYSDVFHSAGKLGCIILTHLVNRGKGRALKIGFEYIRGSLGGDDVVCADSDGQHLPGDIMGIARSIREHKGQIILGSRRFSGKVPLRSKLGNTATRKIYSFVSGITLYDTQTGLRGYSADMLEWLCRIPGERFEYEMNLLLEAPRNGYPLYEVPIDTVYLDHNKSSHFRPVADSVMVYLPILKFSAVSLICAALDFLLVLLIQYAASNLLLSVMVARLCSSVCNYSLNKVFVFRSGSPTPVRRSMPKYFALAALIFLLNYGFMYAFHEQLGLPLPAAKLITEAALFVFSYWSQRRFVY